MITYTVHVRIQRRVHREWVDWMRQTHIPDVMRTGCFLEARFEKAIEEPTAEDPQYSIRYYAASQEIFRQYQERYAPALQADHTRRFAGAFEAFRTIAEEIERYAPSAG